MIQNKEETNYISMHRTTIGFKDRPECALKFSQEEGRIIFPVVKLI